MKQKITIPQQMAIKLIHNEMEKLRQVGKNIQLKQYIDREFPDYAAHIPELRFEAYLHAMGVDVTKTTFQQMVDLAMDNEDYKWLTIELLETAIHTAIYAAAGYRNLIAYSKPTQATQITQPMIRNEAMVQTRKKGREVAQGSEFEEHFLEIDDKSVPVKKYGDTLKIPYECLTDVTIDVLAEFLVDYLSVIDLGKEEMVIDCYINGDGAKNSKQEPVDFSANVIGVKDKTAGLSYYDLKMACVRMSRLGRPAGQIVSSEQTHNQYTEWDEFKKPYQGQPIQGLRVNGRQSIPGDAFITDNETLDVDGKLLLISPQFGVAEYVKQGLMIEQEKLISRQVIRIAFSERIAYMKRFRQSAVIVDPAQNYADAPFAAWMSPTKTK